MDRRTTRSLFALALILVALALIALSQAGYLQPIESATLRPISGVQSWIAQRFTVLREIITSPRDIATLQGQNAELQAEIARLQQQVINLQEQVAESEILAALVDYARSQPEIRYLATNVIGRDVSPFLRSIWIGAGSDDGLAFGMPVVTDQGLVGRVVEVFATVARVQLITDPESAVNVRLQGSRADGVLAARANGELAIELIDQAALVDAGELVLTSGLGGNYPEDVLVGQVISVRRRDFEIFQTANVQSTVDFENLEIVLVITSFQRLPFEAGEGGR
jgi:rod shape-determining protein MreC